ncbi:hypothetical protein [Amycolatopsis sp. NPDC059657]|uniref:hypothetical protein n=1 Tax=Amycolatopsis sp. NPDC059657 TaxID=3346899 RepID=UPI003672F856
MFTRRNTTRLPRRQLADLHRAQTAHAHASTLGIGQKHDETRLQAASALARQYRTLSTGLAGPLAVALSHAGELVAREASELDELLAEDFDMG